MHWQGSPHVGVDLVSKLGCSACRLLLCDGLVLGSASYAGLAEGRHVTRCVELYAGHKTLCDELLSYGR